MSDTGYTTTQRRDSRGKASFETVLPIDIPDRGGARAELCINTYSPVPGKIGTYARVHWVKGAMQTTRIVRDYWKTLAMQDSPARVTAMKAQHTRVVTECANLIIQEATAWYQNKRDEI